MSSSGDAQGGAATDSVMSDASVAESLVAAFAARGVRRMLECQAASAVWT